ncbi:MAG TPA: protein kinase [Myxococcaceae bacterium]|nr:protein kinase [Myxococcaceae bacterium]
MLQGRYRSTGILGQGGMGTVYRVEDVSTGQRFALKRLAEPTTERDRLRFRREFHTLRQLKHPSIVEAHEFGVDEEGLYYTMELLEGADLHELGLLPLDRALDVLLQMASALAFLHSRRLVHRDVATRNIRLGADGRAKLIDFGILATAGASAEVAGTPPYVAPECFRGLPLDHRADLFALGALAYRLLTGRHAYPAKKFTELEETWRRKVSPPSSLQPRVPEAMDGLVMALLSLDPARRPRSAAEVIDRLSGLAGLAPTSHPDAARAYLASPPLVGRQRELSQLKRWVTRALTGEQAAVVLDSGPGLGKTRLLAEVALEAQLSGALVLRGDGEQPADAPYAVVRQLLRELFRAAPDLALQTGPAHAGTLGRVLPELSLHLGRAPASAALSDPNEERLRVQAELASWFLEVARARPLALVVDDAHLCDEASAAVLATLGMKRERSPLVVALALRSDVAARAPEPIAALRRRANPLRLRGLEREQVQELLRGMFGELPRVERLAAWAHQVAGGNPLHTVHLARQLVERGTLRYQGGRWQVPELLGAPEGEVPAALLETLSDQLQSLSLDARVLAEALSVHRGDLPLELCAPISGLETDQQIFTAIDELVRKEVLAEVGGKVRFLHGGFREALLQSIPEPRQRAFHRRLGEALLAAPGAADRDGEIGWHLYLGGDEVRGAERLERAGRRLFEAQSMKECMAPLEAVVGVYERVRKRPRVILELRYMLLVAGSIADLPASLRQVEPLLAGAAEWAGLSRVLKERVPVSAGMLARKLLRAGVRWLFTPRSRCGPHPVHALGLYILTIASAATVAGLLHDVERLQASIAAVAALPTKSNFGLRALLLFLQTLWAFIRNAHGEVQRNVQEFLGMLTEKKLNQLPELNRRVLLASMRMEAATAAIALPNPASYLAHVEEAEKVDLRMFDGHLALTRSQYHRLRGEEELALEHDARAELSFLTMGSVWGAEIQRPICASFGYMVTRDVLGLRRCLEELNQINARGGRYHALCDLLSGEYHRERGELNEALAALQRARAALHPEMRPIHQSILAAIAETQIAQGATDAAKRTAEEAVAVGNDFDDGFFVSWVRSERALALAEAAGGDPAAGGARLDRVLEKVGRLDHPAVVGSLHEARALVAAMERNGEVHHRHAARLEELFGPTRNPVLLARSQRVMDVGPAAARVPSSAELATEAVTMVERPPAEVTLRSAVLGGARGTAQRLERALEVLVWEAAGARGFLYLVRDGQLALAAPFHGDEPATEICEELGRRATEVPVAEVGALELPGGKGQWLPVLMPVQRDGAPRVVAAAAIIKGALPLRPVPELLLSQLAEELWQAGDATAMR